MFNHIKKLLFSNPIPGKPRQDHELANRISACVILLEAALVDNHLAETEMEHIHASIIQEFGLEPVYAEELLEMAHKARNKATDLWEFTNRINQSATPEEKLAIMKRVWHIIYADGNLDMLEDHFAHKLANLLRLTHGQMIETKLQAKAEIARRPSAEQ
ncbi:MAG: TerB family tellurite resistance protein [Proteobacteria bacterium]|nr:TerB family tellurite resistance protein [Pseudomonadota bacterium]MBU1688943.1 TerB family tellurite resistance protein [Pseudomonadota bacterium]